MPNQIDKSRAGSSASSSNQYWATLEDSKFLAALTSRIEEYYKYVRAANHFNNWRHSFQLQNPALYKGTTVRQTGFHGEYQALVANQYGSLIESLLTLVVAQRPAFEPKATNTDAVSLQQTVVAKSVLNYFMREEHLENAFTQTVENAIVYGEGFLNCHWDATAGKEYVAGDEAAGIEKVHEGNLVYKCYEPIDVIRQVNCHSAEAVQWYILRDHKNKWDLVAEYPELAEDIKALSSSFDPLSHYKSSLADIWDADQLECYYFYHDRSPACPDGRYTKFVGNLLLLDGPLPYEQVPIYRCAPRNVTGSPFGYSRAFDLMSLQEIFDMLISTIATNQSAFGVQNIAVSQNSNITAVEVKDGMNLIRYTPDPQDKNGGMPTPINFLQTPAEIFTFMSVVQKLMETISGVNSVARGDPEASLKSGAALALVQSMAIQFSQKLQQSYVQLLESVGTASIRILKTYANVPRMLLIAGESNKGKMKAFTNKDLTTIDRVLVDIGNPMTNTVSGRVELAQQMLQNKLISTPQQFLEVITTGNLEIMIEGDESILIAIKAENEALSQGQDVQVVWTEPHKLHINQHAIELSDPENKKDPQLVAKFTQHILDHMKILSDPAYATQLQLLGQEPLAPPQAAQAPGGAPGQPPATGGPGPLPSSGGMNIPAPQAPTSASMIAGHMPNMPGAPSNPMTKQKFNPVNGGNPALGPQ